MQIEYLCIFYKKDKVFQKIKESKNKYSLDTDIFIIQND